MTSTTTRIRKALAALVVITALAVPSLAAASPAPETGSYSAGNPAQSAPAPDVVVTSAEPGFSWGDAAIGASIALAGLAIVLGLVLSIRAARDDRNRFRLT